MQATQDVFFENDRMWPCLVNLKVFLLSELQIDIASKQYFECVSKYSCMERSLILSSRVEDHPYHFHLFMVNFVVKTTACLPFLKLVPLDSF